MVSTPVTFERRTRDRACRPVAPDVAVFWLRIADAVAIALAGMVAWRLHPALEGIGARPAATIALGTLLAVWFLRRSGAYELSYVFAPRLDMHRQLSAWSGALVVLILAAFALKVSDSYSRLWVGFWFVSGSALLTAVRLSFARVTAPLVETARLGQRTVVVGTNEHGQRLARHLRDNPDVRANVIGFVDDQDATEPSYVGAYPVVGDVGYLVRMIRRNEVDQVVIALPWAEQDRIMRVLAELAKTPVHIRLAPELLRFEFLDRPAEMVSGIPLLRILDRPVSGSSAVVKAAEDGILGGLLLLACAPVMALVALAIKLDSPGPVFFRQTRYGFNNQLIGVWKFRTMHHHMTDATASVLTQRNDPRVTRLGAILRRTSLDELPQLLNVICGEMSLVGPRPHALQAKAGDQLYQDVVSNYAARHRVKPGLTGWAQVNGWRGETDTCEKLRKRVEHDLYYIDHWSLGLDLRILLRTFTVVLSTKNAF